MPTSIKLDPRMKEALATLAEQQMIPVTSVIKQAIDSHLRTHGIDWRTGEFKSASKVGTTERIPTMDDPVHEAEHNDKEALKELFGDEEEDKPAEDMKYDLE